MAKARMASEARMASKPRMASKARMASILLTCSMIPPPSPAPYLRRTRSYFEHFVMQTAGENEM